MGFGIQGVSESSRFFVGLDLGQMQDHSALAVVERDVVGEIDHATMNGRGCDGFGCGIWSGWRWAPPIRPWWSGFAKWCGNGH